MAVGASEFFHRYGLIIGRQQLVSPNMLKIILVIDHPNRFNTGCCPQVINMPVQPFGCCQMVPKPGPEPAEPERTAQVQIIPFVKDHVSKFADGYLRFSWQIKNKAIRAWPRWQPADDVRSNHLDPVLGLM